MGSTRAVSLCPAQPDDAAIKAAREMILMFK
jgi:hypothetical protein